MKKAATYSVEAFLGCQYGVPGFWFFVPGSWFRVLGSWFLVPDP